MYDLLTEAFEEIRKAGGYQRQSHTRYARRKRKRKEETKTGAREKVEIERTPQVSLC